ncbi:MAG TPA: hypothetical protein VGN17_01360 [Bryobacteraceae bacterium]|jgi:hypothetical protein
MSLLSIILAAFVVRDFLLLRMGPDARIVRRLLAYAIVTFTSASIVLVTTRSLGVDGLLQLLRTPGITLVSALFYGGLLALCLWIRQTDRHHFAWLIAVIPNPLLVLALVVHTRLILEPTSASAATLSATWPVWLWIGTITFAVIGTRSIRLGLKDLDGSLYIAAFVNSVALVVLPVGEIISSG